MYNCNTTDLAAMPKKKRFWRLVRCTIVRQSKSCPVAPKSPGNPKRPLQPPGARQVCHGKAGVVFVVQKHKLAAYLQICYLKNKGIGVQVIFC